MHAQIKIPNVTPETSWLSVRIFVNALVTSQCFITLMGIQCRAKRNQVAYNSAIAI